MHLATHQTRRAFTCNHIYILPSPAKRNTENLTALAVSCSMYMQLQEKATISQPNTVTQTPGNLSVLSGEGTQAALLF